MFSLGKTALKWVGNRDAEGKGGTWGKKTSFYRILLGEEFGNQFEIEKW